MGSEEDEERDARATNTRTDGRTDEGTGVCLSPPPCYASSMEVQSSSFLSLPKSLVDGRKEKIVLSDG